MKPLKKKILKKLIISIDNLKKSCTFTPYNNTKDMKTQIELHEATYTRNGIKVNYVLFDEQGDAVVTQVIPFENLETYIVDNDLNRYEYTNWKHVSLECDGLAEGYTSPDDYLEENLNDVVTAYLTSNLEREAA